MKGFWLLVDADKNFRKEKVDLWGLGDMVGMLDIVEMLDNMDMVDNVNIVDSIYMVNMQKTFGYLNMLVDILW